MTNENLSVYDRICRTRKSGRATASDYINATITDLAHERLLTGALALAFTGLDVLNKKVEL